MFNLSKYESMFIIKFKIIGAYYSSNGIEYNKNLY